jgi:serine/threonine-protein kinase
MTEFLKKFEQRPIRSHSRFSDLPEVGQNEEAADAIFKHERNRIRTIDSKYEPSSGYHMRKRLLLIVAPTLLLSAVIGSILLLWVHSRQVEIPDLIGKQLASAQSFCSKNDIAMDLTEAYSIDQERGLIIYQSANAGSKIEKGSLLALTVSLGPDPDELLFLPDFNTFSLTDAEKWIADNHANNLRIVVEYNDVASRDAFIRIEYRETNMTSHGYRRKDYATLFYSKGQEVFEKDIIVPDFLGKPLSEVESWAKKNEITLHIEEQDSGTVEKGSVIAQGVVAGSLVSRREDVSILVSLGAALTIPDFSRYTPTSAAFAAEQISVVVQSRYHDNLPYGKLISQSMPAGSRVLVSDSPQVFVVYSLGLPYLKDCRGLTEGDLPSLFFDTYLDRGADISYVVVYVESLEPKGTIVGMSDFGIFMPLTFCVTVEISTGSLSDDVAEAL